MKTTNPRSDARRSQWGRRLSVVMIGASLCLVFIPGTPALAHDGGDTPLNGITTDWDLFSPSGVNDDPINGKKVHLSSPRHTNSGSRGELWNPGFQENENGRRFNWRAANADYFNGVYTSTNRNRNLHSRGYQVWVGPNPKDGGIITNRTHAQNWGADVTIITHTNAGPPSTPYNLVMYDSSTDLAFAQKISAALGPRVPGADNVGTDNQYYGGDLDELKGNAPNGDAYVELQFHDVRSSQTWLANTSLLEAWAYGVGVDNHLGYP